VTKEQENIHRKSSHCAIFNTKYFTDLTDFHVNVPCLNIGLLSREFLSLNEEQLYTVIGRASMATVRLLYDESDVKYMCTL
jgi:hypothetical protein